MYNCLHHISPSYLYNVWAWDDLRSSICPTDPVSTDPASRSLGSSANGDLLILRGCESELQAMIDDAVLLFLALGARTVCRRHWNRRHCRYVASSRQFFFAVATRISATVIIFFVSETDLILLLIVVVVVVVVVVLLLVGATSSKSL